MPVGQLMAVLDANEEGRLVALPCRAGATVWAIDNRFFQRDKNRLPMVRCRVNEFAMSGESVFAVLDGAESWFSMSRFKTVSVRDFGKTVFLTRAAAEEALSEWLN